ncbi:MAG: hypothetical protein RL204_1174, partial [Bacteroidota bacterium]
KYTLITLSLFISSLAFGQGYFQQEVNYKIDVTLDDVNNFIYGNEEFEYINNSKATLTELYIHLWPNGYKNEKTALAKQLASMGNYFLFYAQRRDIGYIDSLNFVIDGTPVTYTAFQGYEDIALIHLPKPLAPGEKIKVATPFRVKLPSGSISRLGHIGQSYQITQWYPKPAVYDAQGWKPIPYLTQGEFYSEYGSFDVTINLPSNYIVGATGDLQTESEVKWMNELSEKAVPADESNAFPPSSEKMKSIRFTQSNVHDFGWFADKRWIVRKGSRELPNTKRVVTTWALFTPENAKKWEKANEYIGDALYSYSYWTGDYPYNQCTAVDGTISAGGGMEYPNVTVIGNAGSDFQLATVIIHEVGHNWFYGIFGSNERENGWMDEGINSFMETLTLEWKYGDPKLYNGILDEKLGQKLGLDRFPLSYQNELTYGITARFGNDQPIQTHSSYFSNVNYGAIMYKKTGLAFNYLKSYLGDDLFKKCMSTYFEKWKFKHPTPKDIRDVFESVSGKNLRWFFEDVIQTDGVIDYKAQRVSEKDGVISLSVFNAGDIDAPFSVSYLDSDRKEHTVWFDGFEAGNWKSYVINGAQKGYDIHVNNTPGTLDIDRGNNNIRTSGVLRTREPITLDFATGIDDPTKTRLFWLPIVGWNGYDNWMPGVSLHNRTIPMRKFEFALTPMYSVSNNRIVGFGTARINARKNVVGVSLKRFTFAEASLNFFGFPVLSGDAMYNQVNPFYERKFNGVRQSFGWKGGLRVEGIINILQTNFKNFMGETTIQSNDPNYDGRISGFIQKDFLGGMVKLVPTIDLNYDANTKRGFYGARIKADAEYVYFKKKKKKVLLSAFFGITEEINPISIFSDYQRYRMPLGIGGTNGNNDFAFTSLFLARYNQEGGILSNQIRSDQGGVLLPSGVYVQSNLSNFVSLKGEVELPIGLPLSIFGGLGYSGDFRKNELQEDVIYSAGLGIPIVRDYFQIYIPLFYSESNIGSDNSGIKFKNTIMFELNIDLMNPFNLLRNI